MTDLTPEAVKTETSILRTIKKMLGLTHDYSAFDTDIIVGINSAFMALNQLGIGPLRPFIITGDSETWDQFLPDTHEYEMAKTYVYLRVKIDFDPPTSSSVLDSMRKNIEEYGWRLIVQTKESSRHDALEVLNG